MAQSDYLSYHCILISDGPMSLCQSPPLPPCCVICRYSKISSADPVMGKGAERASLALVVVRSIHGFWWFPHQKHFLILKEVLHLKNSSIKSSLPVGLVVFTKNGRIYHSSVFNDKLLQEPSFICRLRTALHLAIFLLSLHLYPSPHQQFPMGIVILKM